MFDDLLSEKNILFQMGLNYTHFCIQAIGCHRSYTCCGKGEGGLGCEEVCKKCEAKWGTPADNCYRRKHFIVPLSTQ